MVFLKLQPFICSIQARLDLVLDSHRLCTQAYFPRSGDGGYSDLIRILLQRETLVENPIFVFTKKTKQFLDSLSGVVLYEEKCDDARRIFVVQVQASIIFKEM